jgi:hypothetical protein
VEGLSLAESDQFDVVLLGVRLDVDDDFAGLAGGGIEFPEAEVLLVDDGLAVGGDAGEEEVAVAVAGDAGLLAALSEIFQMLLTLFIASGPPNLSPFSLSSWLET